MKLPEE